ncbi:hypothetical protein K1719_038932 [Acacia pycnantha]|nr:hypothetical protein K1719_038932 [Acacia pycnantha]
MERVGILEKLEAAIQSASAAQGKVEGGKVMVSHETSKRASVAYWAAGFLLPGAEYGEDFETFRADGLFKVDVDYLNEKLQDGFLQQIRYAMKPDEAYGLIFSWDNVVVDTRALRWNAWKQLASEEGKDIPEDGGVERSLLYSGVDYMLQKGTIGCGLCFFNPHHIRIFNRIAACFGGTGVPSIEHQSLQRPPCSDATVSHSNNCPRHGTICFGIKSSNKCNDDLDLSYLREFSLRNALAAHRLSHVELHHQSLLISLASHIPLLLPFLLPTTPE